MNTRVKFDKITGDVFVVDAKVVKSALLHRKKKKIWKSSLPAQKTKKKRKFPKRAPSCAYFFFLVEEYTNARATPTTYESEEKRLVVVTIKFVGKVI